MKNNRKNLVRILAIILACLFVAGSITLTISLIVEWIGGGAFISVPTQMLR